MSEFRLRPVLATGLLGGVALILIALVGMVDALNKREIIHGVVAFGHVLMLLGMMLAGLLAARRTAGAMRVAAGALAGLVAAAATLGLVLIGQVVNLRAVLLNAAPVLYKQLLFGRELAAGSLLLLFLGLLFGVLGGLLEVMPEKARKPVTAGLTAVVLAGLFQEMIAGILLRAKVPKGLLNFIFQGGSVSLKGAIVLFVVIGALAAIWAAKSEPAKQWAASLPSGRRRVMRWTGLALGLVLLLMVPYLVGSYLSQVLVMVGLYALMGWGLNLEVGWAGLLDLGFVAFFAIGAYTTAILTSPVAGYATLSFWQALPIAVVVSLAFGVLLGFPVLGIRGDYLAIATLGFGEIVRLLVLSEWLRPWTGGSQGILAVPRPFVFGFELTEYNHLYYLVLVMAAATVFVAARLRESKLGRAWMAMREDEDVAQAMGINLMQTKLLAFGLGGAFAGASGAVMASLIGSVFPHSFGLLISINVLALIIVGGMGSLPGVLVGAVVLYGLPELLREFAEFRMLIYGALLIIMMLIKPEGFIPSAIVKREMESQDQLPPAAGAEPGSPATGQAS